MNNHPLLFVLPLLLFLVGVMVPLQIAWVRVLYKQCTLYNQRAGGVTWAGLVERYGFGGPDPECARQLWFPPRPLQLAPWWTRAGLDDAGLFVQLYGNHPDLRAAKIPWDHLRLDFNAGTFVVIEVVPEGMVFVFSRWFVGRDNLRRLRKQAAAS